VPLLGCLLVVVGVAGHQVRDQTVDGIRDSGALVVGHGCMVADRIVRPADLAGFKTAAAMLMASWCLLDLVGVASQLEVHPCANASMGRDATRGQKPGQHLKKSAKHVSVLFKPLQQHWNCGESVPRPPPFCRTKQSTPPARAEPTPFTAQRAAAVVAGGSIKFNDDRTHDRPPRAISQPARVSSIRQRHHARSIDLNPESRSHETVLHFDAQMNAGPPQDCAASRARRS
jgi:hypothetical protein